MELRIHAPWLTRMRRMAIGLSLMLVLVALALPASAAPPEGLSGEVTVVNEPDDPVPVAGTVDATVTGTVPITGSVSAAQDGDWTVDLDAASQSDLAAIAAATSGLNYDGTGNLNVNVQDGSIVAANPDAAGYGSFTGVIRSRTGVTETGFSRLTSISVRVVGDRSLTGATNQLVHVSASSPSSAELTLNFAVYPETPLTMTFPYPVAAEQIEFFCIDFTDDCGVYASWSGIAP